MNQNKFMKSKVSNLPKSAQIRPNVRLYFYRKGQPQDFTKETLDNKSPKTSSFTSTVNSVNFVTICYMVISILRQWHDHAFYNELKKTKYAAAKAITLCCVK